MQIRRAIPFVASLASERASVVVVHARDFALYVANITNAHDTYLRTGFAAHTPCTPV